ncbi:MAG TPA: histidine kinase [Gaiellaceae bacterium]|jgi:signal transduction histidine kinase
MRVVWLIVLAAVVGVQLAGHDTRVQIVGGAALAVAAAGWLGWAAARTSGNRPATFAALVGLGAAGAVLALWSGAAIAFLVVAAIAAASSAALPGAIATTAVGPAVLAVLVLADGRTAGLALGGAAAALAGLVGGIGRRQAQEQQLRSTQLAVAREVHDLLAHTLAAVAVQLEAADAVLADGGDPAKLRGILQRSRGLVREGIEETRAAVGALRDEPVQLVARLDELVAGERVDLRIEGEPRPLAPKPGLALFRAAQEALTNARKHAPGAPLTMVLEFRADDVVLRVDNGAATSAPTALPSGFGLQGMRERLELAGGRLDVGATASGWRVEARVPA